MAKSENVRKVVFLQSLVCPQCNFPDVNVGDENAECLGDGTKAHCPQCNSDFVIRMELQESLRLTTDEAADSIQDGVEEQMETTKDDDDAPFDLELV